MTATANSARASGAKGLWWKVGLGIAVASGFSWAFLRGSSVAELASAVTSADPLLLAAAVAVAVSGFWLRGLRWSGYLKPVAEVPTNESFAILMIGYMVSNFVPGRPGDLVVRPALMRRAHQVPFSATLATVAVERLFDLLTVLLFFATYLAFFVPENLIDLDLGVARMIGVLLLLCAGYGIRLLVGLRTRREQCLRIFDRLASFLPERLRVPMEAQARSFADGLNLFADPGNALRTVAYSLLAWVTVGVSMWLVVESLGLHGIRLVDSCLLMGLGALGVAIPAPGGIGSFHFLMFKGLLALGVADGDIAKAAAILMWGLSFVPVTAFGLWALVGRGLRLRRLAGPDLESGS